MISPKDSISEGQGKTQGSDELTEEIILTGAILGISGADKGKTLIRHGSLNRPIPMD
jgi:hypothetical protein